MVLDAKRVTATAYAAVMRTLDQQIGCATAPEPINQTVPHEPLVWTFADGAPFAAAVLYRPAGLHHRGERAVCFGNFRCVPDAELFREVLDELSERARDCGAAWLLGPLNGSTWQPYRWAITRTEECDFPTDVINPSYYPKWIRQCGFAPVATYVTNRDQRLAWDEQRVSRKVELHAARGIRIRPLTVEKAADDLRRIYRLASAAFVDNPFYVPVSEADFLRQYLPTVQRLPAGFVWLAEDHHGELCGFLFGFPDGRGGAVVKTVARLPEERYRGIAPLLGARFYEHTRALGLSHVYHAFMESSNFSNRTSATFAGEVWKRYALFGKYLLD